MFFRSLFRWSIIFIILLNLDVLDAKKRDKNSGSRGSGSRGSGRARAGSARSRGDRMRGGDQRKGSHSEVINVLKVGLTKILGGAIFDWNNEEEQLLFSHGLGNYFESNPAFKVETFADKINTADSFKLSRLMCIHFSRGTWIMYGAVTQDSFSVLHYITNNYQVPFITPWFTQKPKNDKDEKEYAISLLPDYHMAIIETIEHFKWKKVVYVYDSDDGLFRLQNIFYTLTTVSTGFQISHVLRVKKVSDLMKLLHKLEKNDRSSEKIIVLDSTQKLAKSALVYHARDDKLIRTNFKYFLTRLVLDGSWDRTMPEFGAIDVIGFKLLNKTTNAYKEFSKNWKYGDISAEGALAYDAAKVLVSAIHNFKVAVPKTQQPVHPKIIQCDPQNKLFRVYNHGDKMLEIIKQMDLNGITGRVSFDADGRRLNFTLQLVQMQPRGKFSKIGTWYDNKGLVPVTAKLPSLNISGLIKRNKTYIITTILEDPYYMEQKSVYPHGVMVSSGFCSQLAEMIAQKLDMKYQIRLVRDGNYGTKNSSIVGSWDGMIGELVRQEVDLAIAPLTVTRARANVVDFSQPFLALNFRTFLKGRFYHNNFMLQPFSERLWVGIGITFIIVMVVLYSTAKITMFMWTVRSVEGLSDDSSVSLRAFNICNALWYTLKSFFRQGTSELPRFLSGKIVDFAWKTFSFIIIFAYTANLASIATGKMFQQNLQLNADKFCGIYSGLTGIKYAPHDKAMNKIGWFRSLMLEENIDVLSERQCEQVISPDYQGVKEFAVAVVKNSDLREAVDLALTSLKDNGDLKMLIDAWFSVTDCYREIEKDVPEPELTLTNMAGAFYILGGGLIAAVVVAIINCIYHCLFRPNTTRDPPLDQPEHTPSPQDSATCSHVQLRSNRNRPQSSQRNLDSIQMTNDELNLHETLSISLRDTPRWFAMGDRRDLNSFELHQL